MAEDLGMEQAMLWMQSTEQQRGEMGTEAAAEQPPRRRRRKAEVDQATAPLQQAIHEEEQKEIASVNTSPTDWASANATTQVPIDPAFERIMEKLVVTDPTAAYEQLETGLRIGEQRGEYGVMIKALDEAEANARIAHRLWQGAIQERKRWELENDVVFAAMRTEATRSLQYEKDKGLRSKQITDADVESRAAAMHPDQWRAQEVERVRVKSMVDSMGNLAEMWASRCKSLQVLLSKQR